MVTKHRLEVPIHKRALSYQNTVLVVLDPRDLKQMNSGDGLTRNIGNYPQDSRRDHNCLLGLLLLRRLVSSAQTITRFDLSSSRPILRKLANDYPGTILNHRNCHNLKHQYVPAFLSLNLSSTSDDFCP